MARLELPDVRERDHRVWICPYLTGCGLQNKAHVIAQRKAVKDAANEPCGGVVENGKAPVARVPHTVREFVRLVPGVFTKQSG